MSRAAVEPARETASWSGLRAYLSERFPVPTMLLISAALALGAYAAGQSEALRHGAPLVLDGAAWGGVVLVFSFLLLLRVLDEHKDFAVDSETRPDRPVQRGLVSLGQLKVLGGLAFGLQVLLAAPYGAVPALLYAGVLVYVGLMFVEFFAPEWLGSRIFLYALSHTIVVVLLVVALAARFALRQGLALSPETWAFGGLGFIGFLAVDVLRKIWAPESEVEGIDSYSKRIGLRRSAALATGVLVVGGLLAGWIGWRLGGGYVWIAVVALVTTWGAVEVHRFAARPSADRESRLQAVAGVHLLVTFLGVAVVAAVQGGVVLAFGEHALTLRGWV